MRAFIGLSAFIALSLVAQNRAPFFASASQSAGVGTDADAAAYLAALTASNYPPTATMSSAINTYVLSVKASGVWTTFDVVLPMLGTNLDQQGINLVNPATFHTTNGANTVTYTTNGMTGDGVNGYVDSIWRPTIGSVGATSTNLAISVYCHTQTIANNKAFFGFINVNGLNAIDAHSNGNNWDVRFGLGFLGGTSVGVAGDFRKFMTVTLTNLAAVEYTNGVSGSTATLSSLPPTIDKTTRILANDVAQLGFGPVAANFCYFSAGKFQTSSQVASNFVAVQALQTSLSRANP